MINVCIIGNFGNSSKDSLNGQTVRSRNILSIFEEEKEYRVFRINTNNPLSIILIPVYYFLCKNIIIMPAQRAIMPLVNLLLLLSKVRKRKIHLVAIGGWMRNYLDKNRPFVSKLSQISFIYVQTDGLKLRLEEIGLLNIVNFPNFRRYNDNPVFRAVEKKVKFVCFSRITKLKGISVLLEAFSQINEYDYDTLSIYGPVDSNYEKEFFSELSKVSKATYMGIIDPRDIRTELSKYDVVVFPTYYPGEGFPGTILDSLSSGVPVAATDWKYNKEFINNNVGWLYKPMDVNALKMCILDIINNIEVIDDMKKECLKNSQKYSYKNISKILLSRIEE